MSLKLINDDCMKVMRDYPDDYFDLAIVDPPYGINAANMNLGKWGGSKLEKKCWDLEAPKDEYFEELRRVSVNQIIWGGNYFKLPPSRFFVIWDKGAGFKGRDFAECEQAWGSFDKVARVFKHDPLANGDYKGRIHKTQKPVKLYEWLLANYAKEGGKILDTHLGSGSSAIAAYYAQMSEFVGVELDADYFSAAKARIHQETKQVDMFLGVG